ncbi:MAG: DUF5422 family protein [Victivallaceae bacterium]
MDCKGLFSRGISSFEKIVFPEIKLADGIRIAYNPAHKTAIAISVFISFFMGILKIIILPVSLVLGIVGIPIKAFISLFQSRKFAHYSITWLLCVLSVTLLVVLLTSLALFAPATVLFSGLGVAIALLGASSFIYLSDRLIYKIPPSSPITPPSLPVILEKT